MMVPYYLLTFIMKSNNKHSYQFKVLQVNDTINKQPELKTKHSSAKFKPQIHVTSVSKKIID